MPLLKLTPPPNPATTGPNIFTEIVIVNEPLPSSQGVQGIYIEKNAPPPLLPLDKMQDLLHPLPPKTIRFGDDGNGSGFTGIWNDKLSEYMTNYEFTGPVYSGHAKNRTVTFQLPTLRFKQPGCYYVRGEIYVGMKGSSKVISKGDSNVMKIFVGRVPLSEEEIKKKKKKKKKKEEEEEEEDLLRDAPWMQWLG
ncbi:hypothetical protein B0T14DRAFT_561593 [Immersiella caudata]|uniref:Uncharacterized protein n=1 Tax=Immersiella caudata TaxID=314043 RepID=A0AA40CE35_9PEZI|nr:hypothetical protein B0T14DRAFT_561593 [Immersiella caudata]